MDTMRQRGRIKALRRKSGSDPDFQA